MRVKDSDLEAVCARINAATSSPTLPWSPRDGGGMRANVGNYHLDYAYGGVALHRMESEGGGVSTPIGGGYCPKRELYERMHAYLAGLDQGLRAEVMALCGDADDAAALNEQGA